MKTTTSAKKLETLGDAVAEKYDKILQSFADLCKLIDANVRPNGVYGDANVSGKKSVTDSTRFVYTDILERLRKCIAFECISIIYSGENQYSAPQLNFKTI